MATAPSLSPRSPVRQLQVKEGCGLEDHNLYWLNTEPCGVACASFTWAIVLFSTYAFLFELILPWLSTSPAGVAHIVIFSTCSFLGLTSHLRAMLSNPGAVPMAAKPLEPVPSVVKNCAYCRSYKPDRAHHCSLCRRCVIKMDHHCPWVNNCVGLANQKFFLLFLFYIFAICSHAILTVVWRYWNCLAQDFSEENCPGEFGRAAFVIPMLVFAILFGLFTFCMMGDQFHAIVTNVSGIERLKSGSTSHVPNPRNIPRQVLLHNLSEVFGGEPTGGFRLHWLLPTPIYYPDPERLTGYSLKEPNRPLFQAPLTGGDLEAM